LFGYVLPHKPELKVKEYDYYKAVYCGVCKQMGVRCGCISRFFLSYDSVFLALSHMSLTGDNDAYIEQGRCVMNPFKKVLYCHSPHIDFCADVSVLLVWHKIMDDIRDKGFPKNLLARLLALFMSRSHKLASKNTPMLDDRIARSMDELHELETALSDNMDLAAATFFEMLADISKAGIKDEQLSRVAYEIGKNIGRWIYIIDAYNDIEDDLKNGDYNPLIYRFKKEADESAEVFAKRIRDDVDYTLSQCVYNLSAAIEFCTREDPVLTNIVRMGLSQKQFMVLYPEKHEEIKENMIRGKE